MSKPQIQNFRDQDYLADEVSRGTVPFELSGLSILHVQVREGTAYGDHSHDSDKWVLTMRGCGQMVCGGKEFVLTPGTVMSIPAGVLHRVQYQGAYEAIEMSRPVQTVIHESRSPDQAAS